MGATTRGGREIRAMTTQTKHLDLYGCRHDVLGHYLKAIGLLRVLAKCADKEHRDPNAEGWWDADRACFCLSSAKYPTPKSLAAFFANHYRPTPIFAAWNKTPGGSLDLSECLDIREEWNLASGLSAEVVSAKDRKKPENKGKMIASEAFKIYREEAAPWITEVLDSISVPFVKSNTDHPLFLSRGIAGRAHILRTHWDYVKAFQKHRNTYLQAVEKVRNHKGSENQLVQLKSKEQTAFEVIQDLLPFSKDSNSTKGKGTPFFPDAIKAYNIGSGWVTEKYPFNALDYILAVEGAFAMRGSVGRTLASNSKRSAAFPFVFHASEDLVNKDGDTISSASALWFPVWERETTFSELSSFLSDAQARLRGKEARFNAEFMRTLNTQGVDAGFNRWQEFRFKQKVSDVPWITTGTYIETAFREDASRLNRALHPLDESRFLDQFEIKWKGGKADSKSPHPYRYDINSAMEIAANETTPFHCLDLLCSVFTACRQMTISKSLREVLPGKHPHFFQPLPMEEWNDLLRDLNRKPEFRIARAVASMKGRMKQTDGKFSEVLSMLGSILPLKMGNRDTWYFPRSGEESNKQAVWTGTDVCRDLAAVLSRRYIDSMKDDRPALVPANGEVGARLNDIMEFVHGTLDDQLIARWIEALSLIGWRFTGKDPDSENSEIEDRCHYAIPVEYAALRTLIELECDPKKEDKLQKRRSQQPVALLCQRSSTSLPLAVTEALRWISIWGVPNPYATTKEDDARLAGKEIINFSNLVPSTDPSRLAAAVCIPIHWRDRKKLYRAVCLPQAD